MSNADDGLSPEYPTRHRTGHRGRWIALIVIVVVIAFFAFRILSAKKPQKHEQATVVNVARAASGQMPVILNELGTVTPTATVTVVPNQQVSGYLVSVPFKEGQAVQKGQLLAQIDPRPYEVLKRQAEATLAKDQATLAQARSDLARYDQLNKQKSIAEQTYTDQKFLVAQDQAAVKADQATIAQYALDITYCRIVSPISGRVGLRQVDEGNYITGSSSTGLTTVTSISPTTVEFTVAQNDLDKVAQRFRTAGAKLEVTAYTSDNSKQLATGTLYALSNQMTTATGTVSLRATFQNADGALFPNEFVNVKLLVDTLNNAVLVPTTAVQSGAPGDYVYIVNQNGTASVHPVKLGPSDGTNTVIASGLKVGDTVVVDGTDRLTDGAKIRIAGKNGAGKNGAGKGGLGGQDGHGHGHKNSGGSADGQGA